MYDFSYQYSQFLLRSIPTARQASGGREILCRCFYCPDSNNPSHAHFYISIPESKEEFSQYYCQKCGARGYVTHTKLLEWNIWDDDIALKLIDHNKSQKRQVKNMYDRYVLKNTMTRDEDISDIKLKYINDRIGTNYTFDDLHRLKIILNLKDLLIENNITSITRSRNIIDQLDYNFLGFISIDNAFINMRRICDKGLVYKSIDKRYINYDIFNKFDNSQRFYTIPTDVDLSSPNPIQIHIAEGPFDILSIYENVRHRSPGIYTSVGGSNYYGIINYFIGVMKLPWVEIHIYPDNDNVGSNRKMKWIYEKLKKINTEVFIHRNMCEGEKDFGVVPDRIKEGIINMRELSEI